MTTLVTIPVGSTGSLTVTESAGKITISFTEDAAALLASIAASATNATLKAILQAAADAAKVLPA